MKVRLLKPYKMLEVDAKAGDIVEATFEPWDPNDPENRWVKKRAIGRGIWHVRWAHNFSTSFVDGRDAVAVKEA